MAFTIESSLTYTADLIGDTFVIGDRCRNVEHVAWFTLFQAFNDLCRSRFLEHFILQVANLLNSRVVGTYAADQIDIAMVHIA